jgi:hypothetical protein
MTAWLSGVYRVNSDRVEGTKRTVQLGWRISMGSK